MQSFTAFHIDAVIRVYDEAGNVIQTHEHTGEFRTVNPLFFQYPSRPILNDAVKEIELYKLPRGTLSLRDSRPCILRREF